MKSINFYYENDKLVFVHEGHKIMKDKLDLFYIIENIEGIGFNNLDEVVDFIDNDLDMYINYDKS